ncbi:ABC transporter ATP-binding protein [Paracoccus chinensis]|uniref:Glutathione import ATP-binding protein GsiA n=1 Tax=Paracoccus chinensis TaxID=525640 RepID=A0A1G9ELK4_9RHOB|nr:ABC transporter ATP-binding protein [Paracoccus chinensis]SDK76978.1 peptide/nickel transport system ATP-binding protein [Paracoccus chinensis]
MTLATQTAGAPVAPVSSGDAPVLSVRDLDVSVMTPAGLRPLVHGMSFDLRRGETLCIAGESGSGKSVTSMAIMGLLPKPAVRVTGGQILFGGKDLAAQGEGAMRRIRGNRIAMIFQEPMTALNPVMQIGTQLAEALRAHTGMGGAEARARALEALKLVRISQPERRLRQYPHELSGGMRQRVVIAMALAMRPDVLIADEPTTALDVTVQREVLDLLRDLQRDTGTAVILITHDMGVVAEMANRVLVMQSGRVVEQGSVDEIFQAPREPYTRELLAAVPRMGDGSGPVATPGGPLVRFEDVSVRFDIRSGLLQRVTERVHAVEHVSFDIHAGETLSLVGESGCGKSTLARALVGLVPHEGTIRLNGQPIRDMRRQDRLRLHREVQMVFQDPMAALDPRMTVGELIVEPLVIHGIGSTPERRARAEDLMQRVGLTPEHLSRHPHEFSGGQRQRICIARALALNPKLIIADESVSALDVSVQARVLDLLATLKREFGIAYLFISHDMAVVENISDRVAVMYLGQIVEMGTRAQVFGNPQHAYTRRLMAAVPVPDPGFQRPPMPRMASEVPSPVHPVGQGPTRVALRDVGGGHLVAA